MMSYSEKKEDQKLDSGWRVEEPDEAKYNFSDEKGVWQPKPEDILSLFEKLAQGDPLPLKWTCPGRRPPQKDTKSDENMEEGMDVDDDDSKEEESKAPEMSAFDFDEPHVDVNAKLTPRRAPGGMGRTPRTEKRVARMDNIMKSLHKQQLQRAAEREARKAKGSPSSTPQGRTRLLNFGSPGTKPFSSGSGSTSASGSPSSGTGTSPSRASSKNASAFDFVSHSSAASNTPIAQAVASTSKEPVVSTSQSDLGYGGAPKTVASSDVRNSDQLASATQGTSASSAVMTTASTTVQGAENVSTSSSDSVNKTTEFTSAGPSTPVVSSTSSNLLTSQTDPFLDSTSDSVPADKDSLPAMTTSAQTTAAATAPLNQPPISISTSSDESIPPSASATSSELPTQSPSVPTDSTETTQPLVTDTADQDKPAVVSESASVPTTTNNDQTSSHEQDNAKQLDSDIKVDEGVTADP